MGGSVIWITTKLNEQLCRTFVYDVTMTVYSPSTSEIIALYVLEERLDQKAVDWAVDMLVKDYDSPSLRILAGESSPFYHYEIVGIIARTLRELKIHIPSTRCDAVRLLFKCRLESFLQKQSDFNDVMSWVREHVDFWEAPENMKNFYLLYWAACDLESSDYSNYWSEATHENIDLIVREHAKEWLAECEAPAVDKDREA